MRSFFSGMKLWGQREEEVRELWELASDLEHTRIRKPDVRRRVDYSNGETRVERERESTVSEGWRSTVDIDENRDC